MAEHAIGNERDGYQGEDETEGSTAGFYGKDEEQRPDEHVLSRQCAYRAAQHFQLVVFHEYVGRGIERKQGKQSCEEFSGSAWRCFHGPEKNKQHGQHEMQILMLDGGEADELGIGQLIADHADGQNGHNGQEQTVQTFHVGTPCWLFWGSRRTTAGGSARRAEIFPAFLPPWSFSGVPFRDSNEVRQDEADRLPESPCRVR